jgi:hypothetical protein
VTKTHPKKPGHKPNHQRREELENQEKELGKKKTMEEMLRKETRSHRNQGNTVIVKGGNPKSQSK